MHRTNNGPGNIRTAATTPYGRRMRRPYRNRDDGWHCPTTPYGRRTHRTNNGPDITRTTATTPYGRRMRRPYRNRDHGWHGPTTDGTTATTDNGRGTMHHSNAAAPPTISAISWVIWAWRARLYVRRRTLIMSLALSVAFFIAVRRALCSPATVSTSAR